MSGERTITKFTARGSAQIRSIVRGSDVWSSWYQDADAAVSYAKFYSRSKRREVPVFDAVGEVMVVEDWAGDFKEA